MPRTRNPSPLRPLRLLQIGLGGWGSSWSEIVRAEPEVEAVGWVDADPTVWKALARKGAPRRFASLDAASDAVDADAVLIATGLAGHAPLARAALEAGLHVLIEKPFAPSLTEAAELVALAEARGRTLMVSQNYRFHAAPRHAAALLREGRLGEIGTVSIEFRRRFAQPADHPYRRGVQPLLLDMAIHHADLLRFVLGREPSRVFCRAWNPPWSGFRDPASAVMTIDLEGGPVVDWRGSWESLAPATPWSGLWRIEGERGVLEWTSRNDLGGRLDRLALRGLDGERRRVRLRDLARRDRAGSLAAFAEAVRTGVEPETSGRDNLRSLALCLAAIRSAEEGRPVEL